MMKFKTKYDPIEEHYSNPGSAHLEVFRYEYDRDTGVKTLIPDGVVNVFESIQSHRASTDINNIIAQYNNGNYEVINKVKGFYGDVKNVPDNIADLFNSVEYYDNLFSQLPADLKEKFQNNSVAFWSTFGSESFNQIVDSYYGGIYESFRTDDTSGTDSSNKN